MKHFPLSQEANIYNMKLLPGNGNAYDPRCACFFSIGLSLLLAG